MTDAVSSYLIPIGHTQVYVEVILAVRLPVQK